MSTTAFSGYRQPDRDRHARQDDGTRPAPPEFSDVLNEPGAAARPPLVLSWYADLWIRWPRFALPYTCTALAGRAPATVAMQIGVTTGTVSTNTMMVRSSWVARWHALPCPSSLERLHDTVRATCPRADRQRISQRVERRLLFALDEQDIAPIDLCDPEYRQTWLSSLE